MTALRFASKPIRRPSRIRARGNPLAQYLADSARATPATILAIALLILCETVFLTSSVSLTRCGLEQWFGWLLSGVGLHYVIGLPVLTIAVLLFWRHQFRESWLTAFRSLAGLIPESIALGLILSMLVRISQLASASWATVDGAMSFELANLAQASALAPAVVTAGVHEEVLFRLVILGGLIWVARYFGKDNWPVRISFLVAVSVLFAVSHYAWLNPAGETVEIGGVLCRTLLGAVFGFAYLTRGLALAIGMHCAYNLISLV